MLEPERRAVRTVLYHRGLLVGGAAVAVAWTLARLLVGAALVLIVLPDVTRMAPLVPVGSVLSVLVVPPALSGLYGLARRADDERVGLLAGTVEYARACRRDAGSLLSATLVARIAALPIGLGAFGVLLAGDAALNYGQYAAGGSGRVHPIGELLVALACLLAAGGLARLAVAFHDLPVLEGAVAPGAGWRRGLAATRRRPRAVVRYGLGRALLWSPMVVVLFAGLVAVQGQQPAPTVAVELAAFAALGVLVGTPVSALVAAHHVDAYERTVRPALTDPDMAGTDRGSGRRRAVAGALAVLVVAALVAGTAAVRVGDHRPLDDGPRPVAEDADAAAVLATADRTLATSSYRAVTRSYRVENGTRTLVMEVRVGVDRRDRQSRVSGRVLINESADEWSGVEYYASDGVLAMNFARMGSESLGLATPRAALAGRVSGGWVLMWYPGYADSGFAPPGDVVRGDDDGDWRVLERTPGRVVVGYDRVAGGDPPEDGTRLARERVRVVVDAGTGRPVRVVENRTHVEYENGSAVQRHRVITVTTFAGVASADVRRPAGLGPRSPAEWLWDLVYY